MTRQDGRAFDELRPIKITPDFVKFAEGGCLIQCGNTMVLACRKLVEEGVLASNPIRHFVTGVSAGIVGETLMLDLQYSEDSRAQVDLNCVMNELGEIIELQGTGEGRAFTPQEQQELVRLCAKGNRELLKLQREILKR